MDVNKVQSRARLIADPLVAAVRSGSLRAARLALQSGAAVDVRDTEGHTALIVAAEHGYTTLLRCLLDAKANVLLADRGGWTALMWASRNGHADAVSELCRQANDADDDDSLSSPIGGGDTGGDTADRPTLAQEMVEAINADGMTALMVAASCGHSHVVHALIAAGASIVSASGASSSTALHLACSCGNPKALLLPFDFCPLRCLTRIPSSNLSSSPPCSRPRPSLPPGAWRDSMPPPSPRAHPATHLAQSCRSSPSSSRPTLTACCCAPPPRTARQPSTSQPTRHLCRG